MKDKKIKASAQDVFWHFLAMFTLYVTAISLTAVLFQIVNIAIPDSVGLYGCTGYTDGFRRSLRVGLSFLIVFFPTCVYSIHRLNMLYKKSREKTSLSVRRALIYFTLFVVSFIILFNLVFLLNSFLDGEMTGRFVLKSLSVLIVAGTIFGYYRWDLKRFEK
jgi:hypothetical protein